MNQRIAEIDELVHHVARAFEGGPPNGWLLGWDPNRFFRSFQACAAPLECVNWTTFDYRFCNHFEVALLQPDGHVHVVTVWLSFIADVASVHWTEYDPTGKHGCWSPRAPSVAARQLDERIRTWLDDLGFIELDAAEQDTVVPGVKLELCEGDATLGRCLFVDSA